MKKLTILSILVIFLFSFSLVEAATSGEELPCLKEGESFSSVPPRKCCAGLTGIFTKSPGKDGTCPTGIPYGGGICSDCGNGNCEKWENKCNCPEDCDGTSSQSQEPTKKNLFQIIWCFLISLFGKSC